ncbi:hypothetical protein TYRP_022420 [Tyrophagus putrescentiae]|nr:hypothetical protein TYRP_022420 [Tyrophagus putrescentiae]
MSRVCNSKAYFHPINAYLKIPVLTILKNFVRADHQPPQSLGGHLARKLKFYTFFLVTVFQAAAFTSESCFNFTISRFCLCTYRLASHNYN